MRNSAESDIKTAERDLLSQCVGEEQMRFLGFGKRVLLLGNNFHRRLPVGCEAGPLGEVAQAGAV